MAKKKPTKSAKKTTTKRSKKKEQEKVETPEQKVKTSEKVEEEQPETDEKEDKKDKKKPKKSGLFGQKKADKEPEEDEEKPEKKKKKKKNGPPEPGSAAAFFASLNNMGMGKYRNIIIQSLAMMMNAGLPLIDAIKTLEQEIGHKAARKIVHSIGEMVEAGTPLWRAMEQQYLFTPYELALVRIGEEAGNLARNLEYLAEQQEKDRALKSKVKMAMIYPTIVMVLMFIIIMGLGMFVLPNLILVLLSLNAELPLSTRIVIYITGIFEDYGFYIAGGCIGGFITLSLLSKYTSFKVVSQWFIFHIPGIGPLAKQATIARFGVILGGLLRAGVSLTEALRSLEEVTDVAVYKKFYAQLLSDITQGDTFSKSFAGIKGSRRLLPISVQQLIVTGEQSGTLSQTLLKISEIYERKASETAEKLPVILEPMLLLFIGGLVGTIAFSIIVPIYTVVGNVGGR